MWQSKREISRECNDIIGSAKGSQIREKYWGEVGKGKRADIDLEVRKRTYIFWMKQVPVVIVFNTFFNNISVMSWQSVLLVEETGIPGENHRPVTSYWQTLSYRGCCIEYTTPRVGFELTILVVIGTNCIGSNKSNYHTIMTTTTPNILCNCRENFHNDIN